MQVRLKTKRYVKLYRHLDPLHTSCSQEPQKAGVVLPGDVEPEGLPIAMILNIDCTLESSWEFKKNPNTQADLKTNQCI